MTHPVGTRLRLIVPYGGFPAGTVVTAIESNTDDDQLTTVTTDDGIVRDAYDYRFEVVNVNDKYVLVARSVDGGLRPVDMLSVSDTLAEAEDIANRCSTANRQIEYYVVPVRAVSKFVDGAKVLDF